MIGRTSKLMKRRVLIVDDKLAHPDTAGGRAVRELADEFVRRDVDVVEAVTYEDGEAVVVSDATVDCICLNWYLGQNDAESHALAVALLRTIRSRNATIPVFLLVDQAPRGTITVEVMQLADETVWMLEDTAPLIAGRAVAAIRRYLDNLVPPFIAGAVPLQRGARVLVGGARAPGRRRVHQVAGRAAASSTSTARTCSAPTPGSSAARSARCSTTRDRSRPPRSTRRASSARTAATTCWSEPRPRTARSSAPSSARTSSRCAIATATSRSSRA